MAEASVRSTSETQPASRDKGILFAFSMVLLVGLATFTFLNPHFTPAMVH
jgi:hypothetical protein